LASNFELDPYLIRILVPLIFWVLKVFRNDGNTLSISSK
jgi:hypothetical protein